MLIDFLITKIRLSHHVHGENQACHYIGKDTEHSPRQRKAGLGYFNSQKVDAHGVENRFGAATENGSHHAGKGIRSVGFKNIQNKSCGGGAGKHFD